MVSKKTVFLASVAVLSALVAGAVFIPAPDRSLAARIDECAADEARKQACYQDVVESEAQKRGIAAGLDALFMLYSADAAFASYCHGNTHELGKLAYEKFRANEEFTVSSKTSYCGFGFYHGFIEAMLYDRGDLSQAMEFCEYIDAQLRGEINGISYACYHGIGHGVVDGADPSLWGDIDAYIRPGLTLCAQLPTDVEEHKTRCASGVFNALAIAYVHPQYKLTPNPADPYDVCRRQQVSYERKACYDQMNGYVNMSHPNFSDALLVALRTAEDAYKELAVETAAGYRVLESISPQAQKTVQQYISDCSVLPAPYGVLCARGFSGALIEHGKPGAEYKVALDGCLASDAFLQSCLDGVFLGVYDRLPSNLRAQLCKDVEERAGRELSSRCEQVMEKGTIHL